MPLLSVSEALARVLAGVEPLGEEAVLLEHAAGRVLAQDLPALLTQPPFDASAMDGYAVRASDIAEVPVELKVIGEAAAGHAFNGMLGEREAVRIFTGAPVPRGADAIVIQEDTEGRDQTVTVKVVASAGQFVRKRGMDFKQGDILLKAGRRLGPREISLAAAMDQAELPVRRKPRVAILATGDELVPAGVARASDQIVSSTPYGLVPLVEMAGGRAKWLGIAKDSIEAVQALSRTGSEVEILLTIGGVSVGEHDLVISALKADGLALDFWGIAMRPGKPLLHGVLGKQRVLGVPGNPVSALVCARVFLVPMLHRFLGLPDEGPILHAAVLDADLPANGPRQHYMRAISTVDDTGTRRVRALPSQDSSLLAALADADCLIVRSPSASPLRAGASVPVMLLDF
jgi:molybdopterin molybdotransferase